MNVNRQNVSMGRIVLYTLPSGVTNWPGRVVPAIVTEVINQQTVRLQPFLGGLDCPHPSNHQLSCVSYSEQTSFGTWRWPPRDPPPLERVTP